MMKDQCGHDTGIVEGNEDRNEEATFSRRLRREEEPQAFYERPQRHAYTFSQHGGLLGCLKLAHADRLKRSGFSTLSDEEIKIQHQRERVKELLKDIGVLKDQESKETFSPHPVLHTSSFGTSSASSDFSREAGHLSSYSTLDTCPSAMHNIRHDDRHSSLRFYTVDPKDSTVQDRLESFLNSSIKK